MRTKKTGAKPKNCLCQNCLPEIYENRESHTQRRKIDVFTEDTTRGELTAKAAPEAKANGPGTADPNILDPWQGRQHGEWLKFMNTSELEIRTLKEKIRDLGDWIAPAVKEKLDLIEFSYNNNRTLFDTLKATGQCSDLTGTMLSFKKEFNEQIHTVEKHVKQAKSFRKTHGQQ